MSKIFYALFFIQLFLVWPSLMAQDEACNTFELLPPIVDGQLSNDNLAIPCGFTADNGIYVNECSPCGNKISDDNCADTPISSLCALDGFTTTTGGYTADNVINAAGENLSVGFCNGLGTIENNFWVGFTAQTNEVSFFITASNCTSMGPSTNGIQVAIVETDCSTFFNTAEGPQACIFNGFNNASENIIANNLIPGNPYYIMFDGFAGDICEIMIDVVDGFGIPEYEIIASPPAVICPDVLNPGEFTPMLGTGAIVDVQVGGIATTDLTFYWLNPSGAVIAVTSGIVNGSFVRGTLDASFFEEPGIHSVEIIDNGSCCPLCTNLVLDVAIVPPAAAAIVNNSGGMSELNCNNKMVIIAGNPVDESIPAAEGWQIENSVGERVALFGSPVFVSTEGRLNEIIITQEIIETHFPGEIVGEARVVYGFLTDFQTACFSDAFVTIPFDFTGCSSTDLCFIGDLQFEIICIGNDGTFEINLSFAHQNTTGVVEVLGDGVVYGQFDVNAQPIIIDSLDANDRDVFEFIVRDVQFGADCISEIGVDDIPCVVDQMECSLDFIELDSFNCNADGTYGVTAFYEFTNGDNNFIDVSINGGPVQSFINNGSADFINVIPRQNSAFDIIEICLNDKPNCCKIIEYEQPNCEQEPEFECSIVDFEIVNIDCIGNNEYSLTLDFDIPNISSFSIDVNGEFLNLFSIDSLPLEIIVAPNDSTSTDIFTIFFGVQSDSCILEFLVPRPACLFNSIAESLLDGLEMHPNPTIDILNINHIPREIIGLNIIDNLGRVIAQLNASENIKLDVSNYNNGVYSLQFFTIDNRIMSRRFVKMN